MGGALLGTSFGCLPAKVITIFPHGVFKPERPARTALDDAGLRKVVNQFRRHAEEPRQGVGVDGRKRRFAHSKRPITLPRAIAANSSMNTKPMAMTSPFFMTSPADNCPPP